MQSYFPEPTYFNVNKKPIIGVSASLVNTLFDCAEQITIGDYVSFGHNCMVLTGSHDYSMRGPMRQEKSIMQPVTIKNGVWIASGVIICQGVTIGENAVVGAGSVVTHDIPANELWAGAPCRFIKKI